LKKLKALAAELGAIVLRPYYPPSGLFRVSRDSDGLQLDFMTVIDGIRSFEGLRGRATIIRFGDARLRVASLPEISKSKRAAGRPRDLAVTNVLEKAVAEPRGARKAKLEALKKESDLALRDQIRRLLALPPERRTHFLRKRIALRMSCL
jgi:hypothetical protein